MVTVFAGGPDSVDPVTAWEAISGRFEAGADIVGARRAEDTSAAAGLGCTPIHLDHWDEQYRHDPYGYRGPVDEELVDVIGDDLDRLVGRLGAPTWLIPLGIRHPDHELTAAACLNVAERHPEIDWLVYEELPYARYEPDQVRSLVGQLEARGYELASLPPDPGTNGRHLDKRRVLDCYDSQVRSLGRGVEDALGTDERIHRVVRRP